MFRPGFRDYRPCPVTAPPETKGWGRCEVVRRPRDRRDCRHRWRQFDLFCPWWRPRREPRWNRAPTSVKMRRPIPSRPRERPTCEPFQSKTAPDLLVRPLPFPVDVGFDLAGHPVDAVLDPAGHPVDTVLGLAGKPERAFQSEFPAISQLRNVRRSHRAAGGDNRRFGPSRNSLPE
jgi:hypothetical protein